MKLNQVYYLKLSAFAIVCSMVFMACNDNTVSSIDQHQLSVATSGNNIGSIQTHTVFKSDENVLTYDPISVPDGEQDKNNWGTTVCRDDGSGAISLNDPRWNRSEGQTAFNIRPLLNGGLHAFEVWWNGVNSPANFGEADWINAVYQRFTSNINPEGKNHIWTRYEVPVDGNGKFELKLLADNCSWIYLDNKLVGYQDDSSVSDPHKLRYGVTLNGPATLTYIVFSGGGDTGGKFRLETTTEDIPEFVDPNEPDNQPPVADAGDDQSVEASGPATSVNLDGSGSSDPDGDELSYSWSAGGPEIATGVNPTVSLGLGTHVITLTVDDGNGGEDSDDVTITIEDTTPPEISFNQLTGSLWPPNHRMVLVATGISAHDIADGSVPVSVTVSSNEAANGRGDGNTDQDYEITTNADGSKNVYVRAERSGRGGGRIYTIGMSSVDDAGNSTSASFEVEVAHNQGRGR